MTLREILIGIGGTVVTTLGVIGGVTVVFLFVKLCLYLTRF